MAVILKSLNVDGIMDAIKGAGLLERTSHFEIVMPGLAEATCRALRGSTGLDFVLGPVCACELPLFFGEKWLPPTIP
jgi:CO dehydrogenase/acetyl-CoA synthase gamma subunit (corrinoid Fe-S protein)